MLVDPLAALFRPDLRGETPLRLEITRVDVELLPPLARIAVTRTFINQSDAIIEAVLTLPPAQQDEVIYGLTVTIGGVVYRAAAEPRRAAERAHDAAAGEGRIGILLERLANDAQLVSILGIAPMTTVEVRIESVRPLAWPGDGLAALVIPLSADTRRLNRGLLDAERMLTTADRHPATLTVMGERLNVTLAGRDGLLMLGQSTRIDCAAPVALGVAAGDGGSLNRTACQVGEPRGWEAAIDAPLDCMAGGLEPVDFDADGLAHRPDWIAGRAACEGIAIRVIASSPLADAGELTPSSRAMAAFAAAHLVDSATPVTPVLLRRAANILDRSISLIFLGPEGDLVDAMPRLRKVALPTAPGASAAGGPIQPMALEPLDIEGPPPPKLPPPPLKIDDTRPPGARPEAPPPSYRWLRLGQVILGWAPIGLVVVWLLGATVWVPFPLMAVTIGFFVATGLNAVLHFPRASAPDQTRARRRLPMLLAFAVPPLASWIGGPFGLIPKDLSALATSWAILFQTGCIVTSAVAPLALMPAMRGGRRFTLEIGAIGFVLTFLAVSVATITLSPGD